MARYDVDSNITTACSYQLEIDTYPPFIDSFVSKDLEN